MPNQTPLDALPQYGGRGGSDQAAQYYAGQEFFKLFGRNPSQTELDQFAPYYMGTDPNQANTAGGNQAVSSYFNQQQQLNNGPQQEADQIKTQIPIISDLVKNQTAAISHDLLDPNSPTYKQFSGLMNNMGISPSSGAFQSGLGSTLGSSAASAESAALGSTLLPIASTFAGGATTPYTSAINRPEQLFNNNLQMQDMFQQMMAASNLADKAAPSDLQKAFGMAGSAGQAIGGAGQGMGAASTMTSYICLELIKRGLICDLDLDDFHVHIMPAMFKKGRAFWKYAMDGFRLVNAVNAKGLDWKVFKPLLFDRVMEEPDPCKAVDLYADACHQLCISADRSLWDKRVYRTSLFDSLKFLPLLFCYMPFLKALWKCLRIKTLFVYDKPRCGVHYGL